ncbi:hypothetical protein OROGR_003288 [Orobanche gracilis]
MEEPESLPQILTPCGSGRSSRRTISVSNSPEFEFCNSFPDPNILSADELFSGGVLLPLHHIHRLRLLNDAPPVPDPEPSGSDHAPREPEISTAESARLTSATSTTLSSSKRWRDIFRKTDKKISGRSTDTDAEDCCIKGKDIISSLKEIKKRERKNGGGGGVTTAELKINIWPFSRSRSAGNGASRPRSAAVTARKVSSAPCSRSNSSGESKSRKCPSSPGRGGVHLGRSSPVWQVRRRVGGNGRRSSEAVVRKDLSEGRQKKSIPDSGDGVGRSKAKVLSLNVPTCIGYRQHLSCRSQNSPGGVSVGAGGGAGVPGEGVRGSNIFNIRSLLTKKVY